MYGMNGMDGTGGMDGAGGFGGFGTADRGGHVRRGGHGGHGGRGGLGGPGGHFDHGPGAPLRGPAGHGGGRSGGRDRSRGGDRGGDGRNGAWSDGRLRQELGQFFAEMANSFGHGGHGAPGGPGVRGGRGPRGRGGFGQGFGPGPGFGPDFGAGFGPGGPGRGDGRRRARRGDVRNGILLLLAEESRNGYGMMRELAERSEGEWTPSSGAIYPALSQLEDEGLIELDAEAGPKHYRLTDAGSAEADSLAEKRAPWDLGERGSAQAGEVPDGADGVNGPSHPGLELGNSIRQMMLALRSVLATGDERLIAQAREEIDGLRKSLYAMLAEED